LKLESEKVLSEKCDFDLLDLNLISLEGRSTFNAARLASIPNLFAEDLLRFAAGRPDLLTIKIYTRLKEPSRARRENGDYDYYNFYGDQKPYAEVKAPTLVIGIESKCEIVIWSARIPGGASRSTSSWRGIDAIPFAIKSVRSRHLIGAGNALYRSLLHEEVEIELVINLLDRLCP